MEQSKRINEEYQEEIIRMVKEIENEEWLRFIHRIIKNLIE
nr:MAG TPA: hypothetical protein [Bacteriophage sp.]